MASKEPRKEESDDLSELTTLDELIEYLEELAESYPYLDPDYDILVLEGSKKPIIIMSPEEFIKLERRVLGEEV